MLESFPQVSKDGDHYLGIDRSIELEATGVRGNEQVDINPISLR